MTDQRAREGLAPTALHALVLAVVVVLLAFQLVTAPRASLPAIAEISPRAVAQIKAPPDEQATDLGKPGGVPAGTGANGKPQGTDASPPPGTKADPSRTPEADDKGDRTKPSRFECVNGRQTEDPQSPKCIPFYDGSPNGGRTAPGVDADEIRIVTPGGSAALNPTLEAYFNDRYNFYGRRIRLIDTSIERDEALDDRIGGQQRAAQAARTTHDAFASTDFWYAGGVYYMKALARPTGSGHPVVAVSYQSIVDEADLAGAHPYLWQYPMATDEQLATLGQWVCRRVAGGKAALSGDATMRGETRVLGLVLMDDFRPPDYGDHGKTDDRPIVDEVAGCGGFKERARVDLTVDPKQQLTDTVLKMRSAGVTSVVCACDSEVLRALWDNARSAVYFPEWILPSHTENEHVWLKRTGDTIEAAGTMGLEFHPTFLTVKQDPWYWAAYEGNPGYGWDILGNESSYSRQAFYQPLYRSLLVIASGIQLAGPRLTPETFARGLQAADAFPNPDVGIAAGRVGFVGDHSMTDDAAEYRWSSNDIGPFGPAGFQGQGAGTACFLEKAARHVYGDWPRTPVQLGGSCFTGETLAYNNT